MFIYGQELNTKTGPNRAGVIPFTVREHRIYFLLGIDRRTRELTDFGGGVKSTETMVDAALREFTEETCTIFESVITKEHIKRSPAVTNPTRDSAIFFLHIDPAWLDSAEPSFRLRQRNLCDIRKHNELIGIKWISDQDFKMVAFNRRNQCMWKRIQNILCWNTTWLELRLVLLLGPELTNAVKNSWYYLSRKGLKEQPTQNIRRSNSNCCTSNSCDRRRDIYTCT